MVVEPLRRYEVGGFVVPLADGVMVEAAGGEERVVSLGSVPEWNAGAGPAMVVFEILLCEGRGTWNPGLCWPGEEAVWPDAKERRLKPKAVAVPIPPPEADEGAQVEVLFRLRPLGPTRTCWARVRVQAHLPMGGA